MKKNASKKKKKPSFRHLRYNNFVARIGRMTVKPILFWFFRINSYTKAIKTYRTPYILLANHTAVIDPFIYHSYTKGALHYIVSDAHFRNLIFKKFFMRPMACIPKKKSQADSKTIREIIHVIKNEQHPIGIFPEGFNTWDGASNPVLEGTSSLIKLLKLPVITARAHGAYLSRPRWGHQMRRGAINVTFKTSLLPSQIKTMSKEEIHQKLSEDLYFNEFEEQLRNPIEFPSPTRAEYVERVLYICPHCHSFRSLFSKKQYVHCKICTSSWFMDIYGFFHIDQLPSFNKADEIQEPITTIKQWNDWQKNYLHKIISQKKDSDIIFYDEHCLLRYGSKRLVLSYGEGRLSLTRTHIHFLPYNIAYPKVSFPVSEANACNVQNNEKLEWTIGHLVYQIKTQNKRINTYKYMIAIQDIQKNQI